MIMNQNGSTALKWAASGGDITIVTLLLDRGASIDLADKVNALPVIIMLWRRGT